MELRIVGPTDGAILADIFTEIDEAFFRPHPFTTDEARHIAQQGGRDVYALLVVPAGVERLVVRIFGSFATQRGPYGL